MNTKKSFSTEELSTIIKTPEDAMRLLRDRQAANQELARAATEAYDRYFEDVSSSCRKIQRRLDELGARRTDILKSREAVKNKLIRSTIDGDTATSQEQEHQIHELDMQLASVDELVDAVNNHVLQGDQKLFDNACNLIEQHKADCEEMQEYVNAVRAEAQRIAQEWLNVVHSPISEGNGPNSKQVQKLHDRHGAGAETVKAYIERCAKETAAEAEHQRLLAVQEERQKKEDEELRAHQEALNKSVQFRTVQNVATGKIIRERYNPEAGKWEPCSTGELR